MLGILLVIIQVVGAMMSSHPSDRPSHNLMDIKVTRWIDPEGRKPITFKEYQAKTNLPNQYRIGRVYQTLSGKSQLVNILVNSSIYGAIASSIVQYVQDIEAVGYTVAVDTTLGGTPDSIRNHLKSQLSQWLVGTVLVGDLPVPWFQHRHEWDYIHPLVEEFPIDLYYMDLDGVWMDTLKYDSVNDTLIPGVDSILDTHSGTMEPDIWVGRLTAGPLTWESETYLLNRYFEKIHLYRIGSLSLNDSALNYVDDDWASESVLVHPGLDSIYGNVIAVSDSGTTGANDYKPRLKQNYAWIGIFCHSSPFVHVFYSYGASAGRVWNSDIYSIRPTALFYNLFACSNARYVEANYMGGWYVFVDSCGLGAIGSTKTGSMLEFEDFYYPLGEGKTLGEAFKNWFTLWGETSRSWFYGMTLIGDPTLIPKDQQAIEENLNIKYQNAKLEAYPNPFTHSTIIKLQITDFRIQNSEFRIQIHDLAGRLVRTLPINQSTNSLINQVIWDGRDNSGKKVEKGVYFVKIGWITRKLIKL